MKSIMRPPTFLLPLLLTCLAGPVRAQESRWLIQVDGYGLARLTHSNLEDALRGLRGVTAKGLQSNRLALLCRNDPVPILIEDGGDGWFGPGDRLVFFSVESRCLYTNTRVFHLVVDGDRHAVLSPPKPAPSDAAVEDAHRDVQHTVLQRQENTGSSSSCRWSHRLLQWAPYLPDGGRRILVSVELENEELAGESVEISTPARIRKATVPQDGRLLLPYDREADGVENGECFFKVSAPVQSRITLSVLAARPWDNGCTSVLLKKGPGLFVLRGLPKARIFAFDVEQNRLLATQWRAAEGEQVLAVHLPDGEHRVLLATERGLLAPRRVYRAAVAQAPAPAGASTYLALAPRALMPALKSHLRRRKEELGSARAIALEDVYQHYSHGEPDPEAIRKYLAQTGKGLRYLLLVGPAGRRSAGWGAAPHAVTARRFDTFATLPPLPYRPKGEEDSEPYAVDAQYGDLDGDGQPEIAVGRIPCRTAAELTAVLRKIEEYEAGKPPGPLARRVFIQAGLGRFDTRGGTKALGAMLENMLEGIARKLISQWVPPQYDLDAVYSSPSSDYFFAPSRFRQRIAQGLEKGFFAAFYIGHGNVRSYDTLSWRENSYPTFHAEDAAALDIQNLRGLYFALTCLSGTIAVDRGQLCMAGELCLNPHGPVGVVASSGSVSEQTNLLVTVSTLQTLFEERVPRLGDLLQAVRSRLPETLHGEELRMVLGILNRVNQRKRTEAEMLRLGRYQYTLYGDPATRIRYPGEELSIEPVGELTRGGIVEVKGQVKAVSDGTAWVRLELPRHRPRVRPESVSPELSDAAAEEILTRNNRAMNERILAEVQVPVAQGRFSATLEIPEKLPGRQILIQVYAAGESADAAACLECRLGRER